MIKLKFLIAKPKQMSPNISWIEKKPRFLYYQQKNSIRWVSDWWDLGYKSGVAEQAKFQYSPLGQIFDKGFEEDDKKYELLKRLKQVKINNQKQLKISLKNRSNKNHSF